MSVTPVAPLSDSILAYRLLSLLGMLQLQKAGMTTRNGPLRPQLAKELGLKPRDSYDKYIAALEQKLQFLQPQVRFHFSINQQPQPQPQKASK
jgi:hypothetical protein